MVMRKWTDWGRMRWTDGEWLIGARFRYLPDRDPPELDSYGVLQVDMKPISGPVKLAVVPAKPDTSRREMYYAQCVGCGETSRHYKIRHWGLAAWADHHRCKGPEYRTYF